MAIEKTELYSSSWASCDELSCGLDASQCKNYVLHHNAAAKIWKGSTLVDPQWKDTNGQPKTFDFAAANQARG